MIRYFTLAAVTLLLAMVPVKAAGITGQYVEARTCDVWTGPCFANADFNLSGKNAVMAWRVETGTLDDVSLDGLGVVAILSASDTLGLKQTGPTRAVLIVDRKANSRQRQALIRLAKKQGGSYLGNVVSVQSAAIDLTLCNCKGGACAVVKAGAAHIKTRCLDASHDKACGNEIAFYTPLAQGVQVRPAAAEHGYQGTGLNQIWREFDRRGAYVGSFLVP